MLLGGMATAQEHPRTFYGGRGRPSQGALNEPDVPAATPRWRLDIRGALRQETWSPERGSFSDPHVLSDARRLFYIREGKLHAVDARTGGQLWTYGVGKGARLEVGAGGLVIVAGRGSVPGLDARTDRVRWQHPYRAPVVSRRSPSTATFSPSSSASGLSPTSWRRAGSVGASADSSG